ncbi:hypothetical protein [Capnocytophaga stomatis]|uniref:hypothetical protein n=1 Tax=Capnocytophaga stomatis TaxID=1848904 RepID=UPI001BB368E3|nr:hypothetical protein [Capnocytophaga stomatis]
MATKTIYHLNENCDIVKIEKRTTLLGVAVKRETTIYKEPLKIDNYCSQASAIMRSFSSLRNSPDCTNNWLISPQISSCVFECSHQNPLREAKNELAEQCPCIIPQGTPPAFSPKKKKQPSVPTKIQMREFHFYKEGKRYVCKEVAGLTIPSTRRGKPDLKQLAHEIASRKYV